MSQCEKPIFLLFDRSLLTFTDSIVSYISAQPRVFTLNDEVLRVSLITVSHVSAPRQIGAPGNGRSAWRPVGVANPAYIHSALGLARVTRWLRLDPFRKKSFRNTWEWLWTFNRYGHAGLSSARCEKWIDFERTDSLRIRYVNNLMRASTQIRLVWLKLFFAAMNSLTIVVSDTNDLLGISFLPSRSWMLEWVTSKSLSPDDWDLSCSLPVSISLHYSASFHFLQGRWIEW